MKGIKLPGGLSFLVHWDFKKPVDGLNAFPEDERPTALNAIFQFYHIMVAIGLLLIAITLYGTFQWWRGKIFHSQVVFMDTGRIGAAAADIQSVWMVCSRNGAAALGGIWTT